MASHYTFYCPYCDCVIATKEDPKSSGSPLKHCPKCGKIYIDSYCSEPALKDYQPNSPLHLLAGTFLYAFPLALIVSIVIWFVFHPNCPEWLVPLLCIPAVWLLLFISFIFQQKKIEPLRRKDWKKSHQRLCNSEYASTLANFGFQIPAQYLPPNFKPNRNLLPYQAAKVIEPGGFRKKVPSSPHYPNGSDFY